MQARLSAKSGAISTKLTPQSDTEGLDPHGPIAAGPESSSLIILRMSPLCLIRPSGGELFFFEDRPVDRQKPSTWTALQGFPPLELVCTIHEFPPRAGPSLRRSRSSGPDSSR